MPEVVSADPEGLTRAVEHLGAGNPIAFPTDTVYGLAGPHDRLYELKRRPADMPIAVLVSDAEVADRLGRLGAQGRLLAIRFWPGALTLVVPDRSTDGETIGVRVPDHELARAVIAGMGGSLPTTSANLHGEPTPTDAAGVAEVFAGVDDLLVLDGGACGGRASTVARLADDGTLVVLRPGAVTEDQMRTVLATQFG